nr:sigma-70 family RNA polymerase sigma factor [Chitinophaga sp. YR627]
MYDRYAGALYSIILDFTNDEGMAADALQETFIKIWRNIDSYDTARGRLFTWMHRIARNTVLDKLRNSEYQHSRLMKPVEGDVANLSIDDHSYVFGLRELTTNLKKEHRVLIDLSYFQGYTQEEISKQLNIPLGTVKTRLRAALAALRKMI